MLESISFQLVILIFLSDDMKDEFTIYQTKRRRKMQSPTFKGLWNSKDGKARKHKSVLKKLRPSSKFKSVKSDKWFGNAIKSPWGQTLVINVPVLEPNKNKTWTYSSSLNVGWFILKSMSAVQCSKHWGLADGWSVVLDLGSVWARFYNTNDPVCSKHTCSL